MTELEFTKQRLEDAIEAIDKLQAAQPVWSRERPTVAGWYWWRDHGYNHGGPELCNIVDTKNGLHCFFASYDDQECPLIDLDNGEWAPIPMPREA